MSLYSYDSRYILDEGNRTSSRVDLARSKYTVYTVKDGETLESISYRLLGSQRRYWEIADINPQIKFPLDIAVGTVIRIPT